MINPIDNFVIPQLIEYKGKKLKAVIASGAKLADPAGFAARVNALLAD